MQNFEVEFAEGWAWLHKIHVELLAMHAMDEWSASRTDGYITIN
jgi:hypothetical protein